MEQFIHLFIANATVINSVVEEFGQLMTVNRAGYGDKMKLGSNDT